MTLEQLEQLFADRGINFDRPEFYNDPRFKEAEQEDSNFLNNYAEYVVRRQFSQEYLDKASTAVPRIAEFLYRSLVEDGRLGACLDASLATSKILEQYGFWNCIETGSLTIDFRSEGGVDTRYWAHFYPHDDNAKVGHAWLVVPPFKVIDLTVSRQFGERPPLGVEYVIATETKGGVGICLSDLVDLDLQAEWLQQGRHIPSIAEFLQHNVPLTRLQRRLPPFSVEDRAGTLKYFPCNVTAAEEDFETHTGHCFSKRTTPEVFRDLVAAVGTPAEVGALNFR